MKQVLSDEIATLVTASNPDPPPLLREMAEHGEERNFPILGPDAGRFLRAIAAVAGAERVFEFGSGFGYSAAWFAGALPPDGELVLTDYDADNLAEAREFLSRLDDPPTFRYEAGDAMATFEAYDGPFDVVLVDHDKTQYADAFELVRDELRDGSVVVADNVMAGPMDPDEVQAALDGRDPGNEHAVAVAEYIETVRAAPGFETAFVPLCEGLAVSCYRP